MAEFIIPDYIVSYDMKIDNSKREARIFQKDIIPPSDYSVQHPGTGGIFQNGIFPEFIRDIRGGGGIFPFFRDGSFVLVQRDMHAPRQPGALDVFAGMIQPTVNEIIAKERGLKVTLKGLVSLFTEIEVVPVISQKGMLIFYVVAPRLPEESVTQAVITTQTAGIEMLTGKNIKDYGIEVYKEGLELGTASNGWIIREFNERGEEVFSIEGVGLSFENRSFEFTFPALYTIFPPNISFDKVSFADIEHGSGGINYCADGGVIIKAPPLGRLVWVFKKDGEVYVYRKGKLLCKCGSVDEALHKNFDVEGYRQSLAELVRGGKSPGKTKKVFLEGPINFPITGESIEPEQLTVLENTLRNLQRS